MRLSDNKPPHRRASPTISGWNAASVLGFVFFTGFIHRRYMVCDPHVVMSSRFRASSERLAYVGYFAFDSNNNRDSMKRPAAISIGPGCGAASPGMSENNRFDNDSCLSNSDLETACAAVSHGVAQ